MHAPREFLDALLRLYNAVFYTGDHGKDLPRTTQPAMSFGGPGHRSWGWVEQRGIQLYPHACPSQSQIQPEPDPAHHHSVQPPLLRWCAIGVLFLPMQQPLFSLPVSCVKIFRPTTTWTEISHPSANSCPTPARLCRPVGRSGLTPSLLKAHLDTGQYKNSLCLDAAQ